jgi:hypothetical protein
MSQPIRIGRVIGAVMLTLVAAAALAVTWGLGMNEGASKEKQRSMSAVIRTNTWTGGQRRWAELDDVAVWGVVETQPGNAFALFWPDGGNGESPCEGIVPPVAYGSPMWQQRDGQWQRSAACDRVDAVIEAAHVADLDFGEWMRHATTDDMYGEHGIDLYRRPWHEMAAALARSHARIDSGDLTGAEADARAVVSAGLQLTRNAPHATGMLWGMQLVIGGLDHIRVVRQHLDDAQAVAEIGDAMATVIAMRSAVGEFMRSAVKVAEVPDGWERIARFSENPVYPLGMRTYATFVLGFGWVGQPNEVLFGPSEARRQAVESLKSHPELGLVVARAEEGLDMPLKERIRLLRSEM